MNRYVRMICLLHRGIVEGRTVLKKAVQSGRKHLLLCIRADWSPVPNLSMNDPAGTERRAPVLRWRR